MGTAPQANVRQGGVRAAGYGAARWCGRQANAAGHACASVGSGTIGQRQRLAAGLEGTRCDMPTPNEREAMAGFAADTVLQLHWFVNHLVHGSQSGDILFSCCCSICRKKGASCSIIPASTLPLQGAKLTAGLPSGHRPRWGSDTSAFTPLRPWDIDHLLSKAKIFTEGAAASPATCRLQGLCTMPGQSKNYKYLRYEGVRPNLLVLTRLTPFSLCRLASSIVWAGLHSEKQRERR